MSQLDAGAILWRGDDLLAINKPAGLAVIPGRGEKTNLLAQLAVLLGIPARGQADPRVRVVHRLDKETSGIILFATSRAAQQLLSHQFQNNLIEKQYLALVAGRPDADQGIIDEPLGPDPNSPKMMAVVRRGRRALTHWQIEQRLGDWSLLRVFPRTGKTHQIRVHLRHAGLPLAVDPLYNPGRPIAKSSAEPGIWLSRIKRDYHPGRGPERPLIGRLTLHAHRLAFTAASGEQITLEAPLPKDFRATINQLAKLAR
jgi:23S rRNA pseudouridine955/2504/2580 synthase/23S rRNA pseudouridine1911/1915/1917 synthase